MVKQQNIGSDLTEKQKRFCLEYLIDLNASAAYKRAGYKTGNDASVWASASKLLGNAKVAAYISELQNDRSVRTLITADRVLQEIARVAFANIKQVASFDKDKGVEFRSSDDLTNDESAAIAEISSKRTIRSTENGGEIETVDLKVKMYNKIAALDLAARHLGLLGGEKTEEMEPTTGIEWQRLTPEDVEAQRANAES